MEKKTPLMVLCKCGEKLPFGEEDLTRILSQPQVKGNNIKEWNVSCPKCGRTIEREEIEKVLENPISPSTRRKLS